MAYIQYPFADLEPGQSAEKLLYLSSVTYGNDWNSLIHSHSFSELFYVTEGMGFFRTESERIPIRKNSLILINPNIRHTEISSENQPLTYMALGIDNLHFQFTDSENTDFHVYHFPSRQQPIFPVLQLMLDEVRLKAPGSDEICRHYLQILLLTVQRVTGSHVLPYSAQNIPGECELIKNYLDTHCTESISLDFLAELSHLNKYYLSHIFSKAYGISPINYLLERRILNSQELLKNTDYSITQIADITGFSSPNYFSQSFKKYTGITAAAYRKQYKTG